MIYQGLRKRTNVENKSVKCGGCGHEGHFKYFSGAAGDAFQCPSCLRTDTYLFDANGVPVNAPRSDAGTVEAAMAAGGSMRFGAFQSLKIQALETKITEVP